MIYDVITYNGEKELFELRYNILKDYVDRFIVVEFDKTFSGKDKFMRPISLAWPDKVSHVLITEEQYDKYKDLALSSPNTDYGKGAEHWIREFCQKESIKDCLINLKDEDIVYIGDCDEIWSPDTIPMDNIRKLKLKVYTYYLNNRSSEEFWGTIVGLWGDMKDKCLNHLRVNAEKTDVSYGWHFTSLKDGLRQKLLDSYTEETYANEVVMAYLDSRIANNQDFLGRDFKFRKDESEWPKYLKENREKYLHLLV